MKDILNKYHTQEEELLKEKNNEQELKVISIQPGIPEQTSFEGLSPMDCSYLISTNTKDTDNAMVDDVATNILNDGQIFFNKSFSKFTEHPNILSENSSCQKESTIQEELITRGDKLDLNNSDMALIKPIDNQKYSVINIAAYVGKGLLPQINVKVPALLGDETRMRNCKIDTIPYSSLSIPNRKKLSKYYLKMIEKKN